MLECQPIRAAPFKIFRGKLSCDAAFTGIGPGFKFTSKPSPFLITRVNSLSLCQAVWTGRWLYRVISTLLDIMANWVQRDLKVSKIAFPYLGFSLRISLLSRKWNSVLWGPFVDHQILTSGPGSASRLQGAPELSAGLRTGRKTRERKTTYFSMQLGILKDNIPIV